MPIIAPAPANGGIGGTPVRTPSNTPSVASTPGFAQAHASPSYPSVLGSQITQATGVSPGSAAAQNIYGPSADALQSNQQNNLAQAGLYGQSQAQQAAYAQQQYNTNMAGLGLDQNSINLQQQGLGADAQYYGQSRDTNVGNYQNDIQYDQRQGQYANQLFGSLMKGYGQQRGTLNQQLQQALGQAQNQFGQNSQSLKEQVSSQGAYGSKGANMRQGFLQSTLQNQQAQAQTQRQQQGIQLRSQIAQTLNQKQTTLSLAQRRQVAAQYGIQQANNDYNHLMAGNGISSQQLGVQAARLGITKQQYADALNNAQKNAGLNYASNFGNAVNANNQFGPQQQNLYYQEVTGANNIDSTIPASQGGTGPG